MCVQNRKYRSIARAEFARHFPHPFNNLTYQALMQWQTRRVRVSAKKGIVRRGRPTSTVTSRPVSLNKEPDTPLLANRESTEVARVRVRVRV